VTLRPVPRLLVLPWLVAFAACACERPAESARVFANANEARPSSDSADDRATSPAPTSKGGATGAATAAAGGSTGAAAEAGGPPTCPEGKVKPPFDDGAWSVSSLACARNTLALNEHFVLRAVPGGGDACTCPADVACAPCLPTRIFRDQPAAELYVVLRTSFPEGLVDGSRADVPVRLLSWGDPGGPVAHLFWDP
jgi:hypothetical protein